MHTCGFSHILPWYTYIFGTKFFYLSGFLLDVTQSVEVQTLPLWSKPGAMQTAWQRWATFIVLSFFYKRPHRMLSSVQCCRAFWSTNRQHCRESIELSGRYIDELTAYGIFLINRTGRLLNFGLWDWKLFRHKRLFEAGRPLNFHHFFFGGGGCGAYSNKYGVLRATRCSLRAPLQLNQSNSVLWKSSSEQHRVNSVVSSSSSVNCRPLSVEWIL